MCPMSMHLPQFQISDLTKAVICSRLLYSIMLKPTIRISTCNHGQTTSSVKTDLQLVRASGAVFTD